MYGRSYQAETILRKKANRPFAKEVINEVKSGEDLFTTLFNKNIKEIKHKAKRDGKKRQIANTAQSKVLVLDAILEEPEFDNCSDPFDDLLKGPSSQAEKHGTTKSCTSISDTCDAKCRCLMSQRNNHSSVLEIDKENVEDRFEGPGDVYPACSNNREKALKNKPKFFGSKSKMKMKEKAQWNDSQTFKAVINFIEDSPEEDYMEWKKRTRKGCIKTVQEKTTLQTQKSSSSQNAHWKNDVLDFSCDQTSSEELESASDRRRKSVKPVNSTPARQITEVLPCLLSPIVPVLKNYKAVNEQNKGKCKSVESKDEKLSLDSQLLCSSFGSMLLDSGQSKESKILVKQVGSVSCRESFKCLTSTLLISEELSNVMNQVEINRHENSVESENNYSKSKEIKLPILHSPDPFAETCTDFKIEGHLYASGASFQSPDTAKTHLVNNYSNKTPLINRRPNNVLSKVTDEDSTLDHSASILVMSESKQSLNVSKNVLQDNSTIVLDCTTFRDFFENNLEQNCVNPTGTNEYFLRNISSRRHIDWEQSENKSPTKIDEFAHLKQTIELSVSSQMIDNCVDLTEIASNDNTSEVFQNCSKDDEKENEKTSLLPTPLKNPEVYAETNIICDHESVNGHSQELLHGRRTYFATGAQNLHASVHFSPRRSHLVVPLAQTKLGCHQLGSTFREVYVRSSLPQQMSRDCSMIDDVIVTGRKTCAATGTQNFHAPIHSFTSRRSHLVVPLADLSLKCHQRESVFKETSMSSNGLMELSGGDCVSEDTLDKEKSYGVTFRDVVLERCGQTEVLGFSEAFPDCNLVDCKKIGEGVYGEVFSHKSSKGDATVMKIMPIEGNCVINGEPQKTYEEILTEIVITMELSNLRKDDFFCTHNFPELKYCWCVQGMYPSRLLALWNEYDEEKGSENDSPGTLPHDQIYIVLELSNVGTAMESYIFSSAEQSLSAFMQVTYTLAVAEAALEFEHRDLHWGNILIMKTKAKTVSYKLHGEDHIVKSHGIQASVIDFTLSRVTYDGCCIYNNLAGDSTLFEGKGDYQFDIYRLMQKQTEDNWQGFEPFNNVLWLSYVLQKMLTDVYYRSKTSKAHKKCMAKLKELRNTILDFKSAKEVALSFS